MKRFLLILGMVLSAITMSAQSMVLRQLDGTTPATKNVTVYSSPAEAGALMNKAPRKALSNNQQYMGGGTGDSYGSTAYGYSDYFNDTELLVGQMITSDFLDAYAGGKMVGMRVALAKAAGTISFEIWGLKGNQVETIFEQEVESQKGWNEITLSEDITVEPTQYDGYLIGYKYKQASASKPVVYMTDGLGLPVYVLGTYNGQQSFWYMADAPLAVQLVVEKDFAANLAEIIGFEDIYAKTNTSVTINTYLMNVGTAGLSNYSYVVSRDGVDGEEQTVTLKSPLKKFFYPEAVSFTIPTAETDKVEDLKITITKVNGEPNTSTYKTAEAKMTSMSKMFEKRVCVEEFTGTGCGYCPRGFVHMELMREKYGDKWVGIALHQYNSSDPMYIAAANYAPLKFSSAPSAMVDRGNESDPSACYTDIDASLKSIAPVGVEVEGNWVAVEAGNPKKVTAKATIDALSDCSYSVMFATVADDVFISTAKQSNYYSQYTTAQAGSEMADFCKGGKYGTSSVAGLHFNDVALCSSYSSSKNQVGTKSLVAGENTVECTMTMPTKATLVNGLNWDKIFVVCLVVDNKTDQIVNCAKSGYLSNPTAIETVTTDSSVSNKVYNLAGQRVSDNAKGLVIINGKKVIR